MYHTLCPISGIRRPFNVGESLFATTLLSERVPPPRALLRVEVQRGAPRLRKVPVQGVSSPQSLTSWVEWHHTSRACWVEWHHTWRACWVERLREVPVQGVSSHPAPFLL
jgi:hypothetical protein